MDDLYESLLGEQFAQLHPLQQYFHRTPGVLWQGRADVNWHRNPIIRALLYCSPLPRSGQNVALRFRLLARQDGQVWDREFAGRHSTSLQTAQDGMLVEHFGPGQFRLNQMVRDGVLMQTASAIRVFGIAIPSWLRLTIEACEKVADEQLRFDVCMHWRGSVLLHYAGYLIAQR
jgi:hypothetical protein